MVGQTVVPFREKETQPYGHPLRRGCINSNHPNSWFLRAELEVFVLPDLSVQGGPQLQVVHRLFLPVVGDHVGERLQVDLVVALAGRGVVGLPGVC